ncbi:MAG: hypothetical protein EAZ97_05790 [Bacteroidetes bacterium]|nr:MAG: hypothetical protein EAZ97_05790 [Bacteroidota bacterium]
MKINFREFEKTIIGDRVFGNELMETQIEQFEDYLADLQEYIQDIPTISELNFSNHKTKASFKLFLLYDLLDQQQKMVESLEKNAMPNFKRCLENMIESCLELIKELKKYLQQNSLT